MFLKPLHDASGNFKSIHIQFSGCDINALILETHHEENLTFSLK